MLVLYVICYNNSSYFRSRFCMVSRACYNAAISASSGHSVHFANHIRGCERCNSKVNTTTVETLRATAPHTATCVCATASLKDIYNHSYTCDTPLLSSIRHTCIRGYDNLSAVYNDYHLMVRMKNYDLMNKCINEWCINKMCITCPDIDNLRVRFMNLSLHMPIPRAAYMNKISLIRKLLKQYAWQTRSIAPALYNACSRSHIAMIKFILTHGYITGKDIAIVIKLGHIEVFNDLKIMRRHCVVQPDDVCVDDHVVLIG